MKENQSLSSVSNEINKKKEKINSIRNNIIGKGAVGKRDVLADVSNRGERKKKTQIKTIKHDDLDLEDEGDPVMVSEYIADIIEYMRELEKQTMPSSRYIETQREITWKMRSVLVDWLIEVQWKLKLLPETLFLTVNIIDRFLSLRVVSVDKTAACWAFCNNDSIEV